MAHKEMDIKFAEQRVIDDGCGSSHKLAVATGQYTRAQIFVFNA